MPSLVPHDLPELSPDEAVDLITEGILFQMYGKDPELDQKIDAAFRQWKQVNAPISVFRPEVIDYLFLKGAPGHGKTTVYRTAAKRVCQMLDLELITGLKDGQMPTKQHFLLLTKELAGANQATDIGGIPARKVFVDETGREEEYMTKLLEASLIGLNHAAGGMLILDDVTNAGPAVQNIINSLVLENRFQGLEIPHAYLGLTGNFGAKDGTHVAPMSNALKSRCQTYYVETLPKQWVRYVQEKYADAVADGGVGAFLQRNPEHFAKLPPRDSDGGFPCPRSWEMVVRRVRQFMLQNKVHAQDKSGAADMVQRTLQKQVHAAVGAEAAFALSAYFYALLTGADPIAESIIQRGKLNAEEKKLFASKFSDGLSAGSMDFSNQYALALADHACAALVSSQNPDKDLEKVLSHYATGLYLIAGSGGPQALSVQHLKNKLIDQIPDFRVPDANGSTERTSARQMEMAFPIKERIVRCFAEHPEAEQGTLDNLVDVISGMTSHGHYTAATASRGRKGKK